MNILNIDIYDNEDDAETQAQVYRNLGRVAETSQGDSLLIRDHRDDSIVVDDDNEVWVVVAR